MKNPWSPASAASRLPEGTVCWVFSKDTDRASAAVVGFEAGRVIWRCHGQEHFRVSGVTDFFVLPGNPT
jgi:hypothetical protein